MSETPPTAYQSESADAIWAELDALLRDDPSTIQDEQVVAPPSYGGAPPPQVMLERAIDRVIWAEQREAEAAEMEKRFQARKHRYGERADRIRASIKALFKITGSTAAEGELGAAAMAKGRRKVMVIDEGKIPLEYIRVVTSVDKEAIGKILTAGKTVEGAEFSNPEPTLRITPF